MQAEKAIEIQGVSWAYGPKPALSNVDLSIGWARFTSLLGPNGAGKSTLISLLSGLMVTRNGRVRVGGHDISRQPRRALALMGFVFQQQTLDLDLTVQQNMAYFAAIRGLSGRVARRQINTSLTRMGLDGRGAEKTRALNGGHRRRLEIARALVHTPKILILDEPTTGLDVPSRADIVAYLHALCADEGLTVLWATHLVDEVWADDDLIVLHNGVVKTRDTVSGVLAHTRTDSVLQAFNRLTDNGGPQVHQR